MSELAAAALGGVAGYALGRQVDSDEDAETLVSAADTIEQLQLEVNRLEALLAEAGSDGQISAAEAAALEAQIATLQQRVDEHAAAAAAAQEALEVAEREIRADANAQIAEASERATTAETIASQLRQRVTALEAELQELSQQGGSDASASLSAALAELSSANAKLDAIRRESAGSIDVTTTVDASVDVGYSGFDQSLPTVETSPYWADGSLIRATDAAHSAATVYTNIPHYNSKGKEYRAAALLTMRQTYKPSDGIMRLALSVPGSAYPTGLISLLIRGSVTIQKQEYGLGTALSRMRYTDLDLTSAYPNPDARNITSKNPNGTVLWDYRVPSVCWVRAIAADAVQIFLITHPTKFASKKNKTFAVCFAGLGAGTPLDAFQITALGVNHEFASVGLLWKGARAASYMESADVTTATSTKPKKWYVATSDTKSPTAPSARTPSARRVTISRPAKQTVSVPKDWVLEFL